MAQTSNSSLSSYVNPLEFFQYISPTLAGDMLRFQPSYPRASFLAMIDKTNPAGQKLLTHLGVGAGEIESACAVSKRYLPEDLQALTGVSLNLLQALNSYRALWSLYKILKPGTGRPEDCPGATESFEMLKALRDGELIFTFEESEEAGLPHISLPSPSNLKTPNIVGYAYRLFPNYSINSIGRGRVGFEN